MSKYTQALFAKETPQTNPIPKSISTAKQTQNSAGGFVFSLDKWKRLERFLILGSDSNTYYASAQKLTKQNAECVNECWTENAVSTAAKIATISVDGRAARNSAAIFAVALGTIHKDKNVRQEAFGIVHLVCRTSTHLFEFVDTCKQLGKGWGRGMKNAVANWYNNKTDEQLTYQLIKYRQREGYTHERLIRLSHPSMENTSPARHDMYDWLRGRGMEGSSTKVGSLQALPQQIRAHVQAMKQEDNEHDLKNIVSLISEFNLPWEALPTWANTKPEVWLNMLPKMPLTAMIRNLGNMTRLNVPSIGGDTFGKAVARLNDLNELKKARIHPFNLLTALKTYSNGCGFRGTNYWTPLNGVEKTLENAFYGSFQLIQPSNKRIMLALDVSGSMDSQMNNSPLTVREASAAMAMATLNVEEHVCVTAFTSLHAHNLRHHIIDFPLNRGMKLKDICATTSGLPHSGTDCSLPMLHAIDRRLAIDAFVIYTDNETWAGSMHPVEALRKYRRESGIDAKLIVVGMTSTGFSIADPNDAGMLDVVGFDASAPAIIADFIRGEHLLLENNTSETSEESGSDTANETD